MPNFPVFIPAGTFFLFYSCWDAVGAAIIGGTSMNGGYGTISGTLIGVYIMALLKIGLPLIGLAANWQQVITGLVLIFAVLMDVIRSNKRK